MSWTIGELSRRTGVPASTLRFWERAGLIHAPRRASGQRRYDPAALATVELIRLAQMAGCSIADIRDVLVAPGAFDTPAARWNALVQRRASELEERIAALTRARRMLGELAACSCASLP